MPNETTLNANAHHTRQPEPIRRNSRSCRSVDGLERAIRAIWRQDRGQGTAMRLPGKPHKRLRGGAEERQHASRRRVHERHMCEARQLAH
eukprot:1111211-Prymnesium_polylepis.1